MSVRFTNMYATGYLPHMLDEDDPRSAVEQLNTNYAHGGGWRDFKGFKLVGGRTTEYGLAYPGDPVMREISRAHLRDQLVVLFESSWVAVIQPDDSYRVARMD